MRPTGERKVTGIVGEVKVLGTVKLQIPFKGINLTIDFEFLVVKLKVPTLLSIKDMMINGLDISLQKCHVSLAGMTHTLSRENYFLVHRWKKEYVPFELYTESEPIRIHAQFGHP